MGREKVFRFKRFVVINDRSAMKVGTDGVLLGAWCPVDDARHVLDVGTGCGVIALMVAQRNLAALIDGIDIDHGAIEEAAHNFASSPWSDRVKAIEMDFNDIDNSCYYDLVISNPPYFTDSLPSNDTQRTLARHTRTLTYRQLIEGAARLLTEEGTLALISPTDAAEQIVEAATFASLPVRHVTHVMPVEGGEAKRTMWELSRRKGPYQEDSVTIAHTNGKFTQEYIALTEEFYLRF